MVQGESNNKRLGEIMLDMRKTTQDVRGFYVWKNTNKKYWEVGKNGTSNHTTIPFGSNAKNEIINFIEGAM